MFHYPIHLGLVGTEEEFRSLLRLCFSQKTVQMHYGTAAASNRIFLNYLRYMKM
jgi:hypothetical protein